MSEGGCYHLTRAQASLLVDQLAARIDVVLDTFGLRRAGPCTLDIGVSGWGGAESLHIVVPFKRREAV